MAITITSRIVSDVVILDLSGKFSVIENSLRELVNSFLDEGRRNFLLNLAGVPYIGTWGLTQMISIWKLVRGKGGTMGLLAPLKPVREVFQITKLDTVFPLHSNEADALRDFSKSPQQ